MKTETVFTAPEGLTFEPLDKGDKLLAFIATVGMATTEDGLLLKVDCNPEVANSTAAIHGGAISTLFDIAVYQAALAAFGSQCATISLDVKYLRAGNPGIPIYIKADVLRAGRTMMTATASAFQNEKLIAFATAQFAKV